MATKSTALSVEEQAMVSILQVSVSTRHMQMIIEIDQLDISLELICVIAAVMSHSRAQ